MAVLGGEVDLEMNVDVLVCILLTGGAAAKCLPVEASPFLLWSEQ